MRFKEFIIFCLRGIIKQSMVKTKSLKVEMLNQLQTLILLIFNVKAKRTSASLIANCMYFDLIDAGFYDFKNI